MSYPHLDHLEAELHFFFLSSLLNVWQTCTYGHCNAILYLFSRFHLIFRLSINGCLFLISELDTLYLCSLVLRLCLCPLLVSIRLQYVEQNWMVELIWWTSSSLVLWFYGCNMLIRIGWLWIITCFFHSKFWFYTWLTHLSSHDLLTVLTSLNQFN